MKTTIRELRPEDIPSFVDLCETREELDRHGAEQRVEAVEWAAFHNPIDDGKPTYFVGVQGDRVVAHLGRAPTQFRIRGELEMASYFNDLYVLPEVRAVKAQGFFLTMNLYRKAEKASQSFSTMIWTNEINIALQKARKYHQMWADQYVLILGLSEKIEAKVPAALTDVAKMAARTAFRARNRGNSLRFGIPSRSHRIERIDCFDARFDEFDQRCGATLGIAPKKDSAYLNWKYSDRPQLDRSMYQLLDSHGGLAGYCVLVNPDAKLNGSIAELVTLDNDPALIQLLLDRSVKHMREVGADRLYACATSLAYSDALIQRLFRIDEKLPVFLANPDRSPQADIIKQLCNWHVSSGDSVGPF